MWCCKWTLVKTGKLKPNKMAEPWPINWFTHGIGWAALWQASCMTVPSICNDRKAVATKRGKGHSPLCHCQILKKANIYPPKKRPSVGLKKFGGSTYSLISFCQLKVVEEIFFNFLFWRLSLSIVNFNLIDNITKFLVNFVLFSQWIFQISHIINFLSLKLYLEY